MKKNKDISVRLEVSESVISRLLTGQRKVSWPMAEKLSGIFPGKSLQEWKRSKPAELRRAFSQLDKIEIELKESA